MPGSKLPNAPVVVVARSVYASLAHRYWNSDWSHEKNVQVYGRDASEVGIGSNMRLEAALQVSLANLATSTEANAQGAEEECLQEPLARLKALIDHQSFSGPGPSTLEIITGKLATQLFQEAIAPEPSQGRAWHGLTVWETERLACRMRPALPGLTLIMKIYNLTLEITGTLNPESGLVAQRSAIVQAVDVVFQRFALPAPHLQGREKWGRELYLALTQTVPGLATVQIDLGRHEYLKVQ